MYLIYETQPHFLHTSAFTLVLIAGNTPILIFNGLISHLYSHFLWQLIRMDPVPFALPEVILNNGEEPDRTQSGSLSFYHFPPHYHQPFPAELNTRRLSDHSLQTSHETTGCEAGMDGSASQGAATTVAEILSRISNAEHRTSWRQMSSNTTLMGPIQHQETPSFLHFLPGFSPSPLSLQCFPPDATQLGLTPLSPEFIFTQYSPPDTCWLNMSPLSSTPDSSLGLSPFVLLPISSPTESCFSPARSWLHQPEFHPSWCTCPRGVPVHQPCSPGL